MSPSHRPTSKTQDTMALHRTRRASPLPIAPQGLDPGSLLDMVSLRMFVCFFYPPFFVLNVPFSIFNFLISLRPHHQVRHLVSHPLPSARSSPRSRPSFNKISKVRTSHMTPCGFVSGSICFESVVSYFLFQLIFRIESCFVAPVCV